MIKIDKQKKGVHLQPEKIKIDKEQFLFVCGKQNRLSTLCEQTGV